MIPRGIIILEGGDCAGKSTLARHFIEKYGAKLIHNRVWPDMWRYHVAAVRLALRWADEHLVIVDRLWLSELVYGSIYRGAPAYDIATRSLERALARAGTVTVLCAPRDQELQLARHGARLDREKFQDVRRVVAAFADLRDGNLAAPGSGYLAQLTRYGDYAKRNDVIVYDVDRDGSNLTKFTKIILRRFAQRRWRQDPAALRSVQTNIAGHVGDARFLFIGEAASPHRPAATPWPFFWGERLSATSWLNARLHAIGFDETKGLWTNARDPNDQLPGLLWLGKTVITLGTVARDRVRGFGVEPAACLPHPQHTRRFHAKEPEAYEALLRDALRTSFTIVKGRAVDADEGH